MASTRRVPLGDWRAWVTLLCTLLLLLVPLGDRTRQARAEGMAQVIVTLDEQAPIGSIRAVDRSRHRALVVRELQDYARSSQQSLLARLRSLRRQGAVSEIEPLWITNAIAVTGTPQAIVAIERMPHVQSVVPDTASIAPQSQTVAPNVSAIGAPALWSDGVQGDGVRIAVLDSGVSLSHPDIAENWVGGASGWFDPYGQHPNSPFDATGHGTQVTGVLVGHAANGKQVGVAPGARWLAARVFNDAGSGTLLGIHQALQWAADPDGDPSTDDAPDVINNSWDFATPGCNTEFQPDLRALATLDIVSVFAAGNGGPGSNSSYSPANYPEVVSVGAVDNVGGILASSSRGATTCGGRSRPFPDLVAPGSNIRSTDLFGGMSTQSGTSMAAPHVTGALGLLASGRPCLSHSGLSDTLLDSAQDLGTAGTDNVYGHGLVDVDQAWQDVSGPASGLTVSTVGVSPSPATSQTVATATAASPRGIATALISEPGARSSLQPTPMKAVDEPFGTCSVTVRSSLDVSQWPVGQHVLAVAATATGGATQVSPVATLVTGPQDTVFVDSFESRDLRAWLTGGDESALTVSSSANLVGQQGLRIDTKSGVRAFLVDESPTALPRYRAGFWFKPEVTRTPRKGERIFQGLSGDGSTVFDLRFRRSHTGVRTLRLGVSTDSGIKWSKWRRLAPGAHHVEVIWKGGTLGSARLATDGATRAKLARMNTGSARVELVRLGATTPPKADPTDTYVFDGFASTVRSSLGG